MRLSNWRWAVFVPLAVLLVVGTGTIAPKAAVAGEPTESGLLSGTTYSAEEMAARSGTAGAAPPTQVISPAAPPPRQVGGRVARRGTAAPSAPRGSGAAVRAGPAAPGANPPALGVGFQAIPDDGWIPPDTNGAVGPSHVMAIHNGQVRVQDKTGVVLMDWTLHAFFGLTSGTFDPKVIYSHIHGRFFAVTDVDSFSATSGFRIAVSSTSNPLGAWTIYSTVDADGGDTHWADFPGIGVNDRWLVITNNMFPIVSGPVYPKMWVFEMTELLAGAVVPFYTFGAGFDDTGFGSGFTLKPAVALDLGTPNLPILDTGWLLGPSAAIRMSQLTGTESTPSWSLVPGAVGGVFLAPVDYSYSQLDAPQLGGPPEIETNDARINAEPMMRDNSVWMAHSGGYPASAVDTTASFWYELDPSTTGAGVIKQSGFVDFGAGDHMFFPSIVANSFGQAVLGCANSWPGGYANGVAFARDPADAPGAMPNFYQLKLGEGWYSKFYGGTRNRWGDYSSTVLDPDGMTFWSIQEYALPPASMTVDGGLWATWWSQLTTAAPPTVTCPGDLTLQCNGAGTVWDWSGAIGTFSLDDPGGNFPLTLTVQVGAGAPITLPSTYPGPATISIAFGTASIFDGLVCGPNLITVTVENAVGLTDSCSFTATVEDTTPPTVTCGVLRPLLYPPRGMMLPPDLSRSASDACDSSPDFYAWVYSDEPDTGVPYSPDAAVVGFVPGDLLLRAERDILGDGRVYLVFVEGEGAGCGGPPVSGWSVCTVVVPRTPTFGDITGVMGEAATAAAGSNLLTGTPPASHANVILGRTALP